METYTNIAKAIAEEYKNAKTFFDGTVKVGKIYVFCIDRGAIVHTKDVVKACFTVHGCDASDEYSTIRLTFTDGSEDDLCKIQETDPGIAESLFSALSGLGIKTVITDNR